MCNLSWLVILTIVVSFLAGKPYIYGNRTNHLKEFDIVTHSIILLVGCNVVLIKYQFIIQVFDNTCYSGCDVRGYTNFSTGFSQLDTASKTCYPGFDMEYSHNLLLI